MANGKYVTYIRVSTQKQGASGLGLEAQQAAISAWLDGGHWKLLGEFVEVETSTRKGNNRPELAKALAMCKATGAMLLIAKLDRLARNVAFVSNLMESSVEFTAVDFPTANRLTVHVLAAVAEHEAVQISERTKSALAAAKARGVKLGGHRGNLGPVERSKALQRSIAVRQAKAAERAKILLPIVRLAQKSGAHSFKAIADTLNENAVPAPRGGKWLPMQIRRILSYAL